MRQRKILVADLLCGAGGSSTGCERALRALGLEMELVCVNHWPIAIETHQKNHPGARHYVQDIATVRPSALVPEGYLDLLMASPTCTHHSVARGGKPTSDQQRSDPWHIITWLTELRVKRIIIENVWEFTSWGPVDARTGKPIKSRKGEYFLAWINALRALGFVVEWRKLNAADYGDATTRQRFILMGRSDGKKIVWPTPTHAKRDDRPSLLPALQTWRPAREIIDWKINGKSIFSRKKPLAPKTLARIEAGAVKFGWPEPFLVILRNHMAGRSVDQPVPTIAANGTHIALAQPIIVNMKGKSTASDVDAPLPTQTSHAAHLYAAEPLIMNGRKNNKPLAVSSDPIPTLDTKGGIWLAEPFVIAPGSTGAPRETDQPLPTITTGGAGSEGHQGCARPMLVEPFVLNRHGDNGGTRAHAVDEPLPTSDCRGAGYVIEPFILSRCSRGAPRATDDPMCTQTAQHAPVLVAPYYGSGSGETCKSVDSPLDTIPTRDRFGIVVPITHSDGLNRARSVDDPLATITTAHRGELAFITAQHGEREGQAPRVHSVDNPAPTIAARGHVDLAEGAITSGIGGQHYDILFRMLEPHELAAAMGFDTDEAKYEFAGTKTQKIKQIGNAVSVSKMKACVGAIMADAGKAGAA